MLTRSGHTANGLSRSMIRVGDLVLDPAKMQATRAGRRLQLPRNQFLLLEMLARSCGGVVTRTILAELLWGPVAQGRSNALNIQMSRLRREVDGDSRHKLIRTRRGVGYLLQLPPASHRPPGPTPG